MPGEGERWTIYVCEKHGPMARASTHLAHGEPVGGRLACSYCVADDPRNAPAFVREVEVVPASRLEAAEQEEAAERDKERAESALTEALDALDEGGGPAEAARIRPQIEGSKPSTS